MLSLERAKQLLNDPTLSDEEVERIRDEFRILAEIIFEQWQAEKNKIKGELKNNLNENINNKKL